MKIGIDLRFINDDIYSKFILQILENFIKFKIEDEFIIYSNKKLLIFEHFSNCINKKVKIKLGSLAEQTTYRKILKKDANHIMFFFNQFKPIFYKKDYVIFTCNLKDFYYSNFASSWEKHKFFYLAEKNFKNSKKIICLDTKTREELIEKFDIKYENIEILNGFFPYELDFNYEKPEKLEINLSKKYAISTPFFIYSGGASIEKNYEKLISVLAKIRDDGHNISLVFLGDEIASNVNLRISILEKKLQKNIFFLGEPKMNEKKHLYEESLGVIFPSFYEPFPFKLTEALCFDTPILSSDLRKIKVIFGDKISYFSPISKNSIYEVVSNFLKEKDKKNPDYSEIREKYNLKNTLKEFKEIFSKL